MKKISLITLGCPKNLVDTESMAALLGEEGYILTNFVEEADIVIINTCGFIKSAVEESESVIGKILENKGDKKVIVVGCLVQRYKEDVIKNKKIDGIVGTGDPGKIVEAVRKVERGEKVVLVEENTFITEKVYPRLISTYPYAYIKISEGCENFCKYCLIPKLRGPIRSRKIESIIEEAEKLVEMGYKEIILVAQDTTNYGKDFKDGTNLEKLLKELVKVDVKWIRIMYTHPAHIRDTLLKIIADEEKICKYI
ncbi:MiaB/RimO family radical SAM methylthiotransferase, partial [bacterium]|nr:MiaB/RimO family radical SAM methylthiotransferase [bacterium]